MSATSQPAPSGIPGSEAVKGWTRLKLDWFDLVGFLVTAVVSFAVIVPLLVAGRKLTGGDGLYPVDQLQYLSWIRQAADHGLMGNRWDMLPDTRVFLHPAFLLSGLGVRWFGLPIEYSNLAIWKPVSIVVVFFGCRQYARRLLPAGWPARVGFILALLLLPPFSSISHRLGSNPKLEYNFDFITTEMWPGQQLLGYEIAATAIFMVPLLLLAVEKVRGGGQKWALAGCSLGALFVMWLQPWQGVELLVIIAATELWRWGRKGVAPYWPLFSMAVLGALPAIYYATIERTDPAWALYGRENRANVNPIWDWSIPTLAMALAPLAIPAIISLRNRDDSWQGTALRFWPVAVAVAYLQPTGTFPFHSFQGLTIPLSVMAVQAFTINRPKYLPRPRWWWVVPVLFVLIVPGTVHRFQIAKTTIDHKIFPYEFQPGERQALAWLNANQTPGAVLTDEYAGLLVPAYARREAYVGTPPLTPEFKSRVGGMNLMMLGYATPKDAQNYVKRSGTRFVFEACAGWPFGSPNLMPLIGPLVERRLKFGCAQVLVLKPTPLSERLSPKIGGPGGPP